MKKEYDFRNARRGQLIPTPGMTRISIHIEDEILDWFQEQIRKASGGSYMTMINEALREYMRMRDGHAEERFRKVIREELVAHDTTTPARNPPSPATLRRHKKKPGHHR
jgi:hypothetical protein